ncbi:MAG: tetratricopeptide repeat protein [Bacteroidota bacterium]
MKKIVFWISASLGLFLFLFSSFSDPGAKIGKSFQKACQEVSAARKMESSSYASAFKLYNNAVAKINNITDKYSSSEIALNLFKNQQKIGPYPFLEFKEEIFPKAKLKAEAENNPLNCSFYAVNLLDTIQFDDELKLRKAVKLTEISIKYSKLWRFKKAASVLEKGRSIVQTIYSDYYQVSAFAEIAQILGAAGKKKEALQILSQAKTIAANIVPYEQPEALGKIISAYCAIGQFELAMDLTTQFKSQPPDEAWSIIAKQYAVKEKFKSALKTAENINDDDLLAETLRVIIEQYAANGRFEKAQELAAKIRSSNIACKVSALADIGFYAGKEGQRDLALSNFEQAVKIANQFESYQLPQKLSALNYVALRFIKLQDYQNAGQLLESNSSLATKLSEFNRAEAFAEIAVAYDQMGEVEKAIQLVQKYIPEYLTIDVQGATFARLALQNANRGQYQQALALADKIADETTLLEVNRASVLSQIAILAAAAKEYQTALKIAKEINSSFYRPWTFGEIALQIADKRVPLHKKPRVKQYLHQIITELEPKSNPTNFPD